MQQSHTLVQGLVSVGQALAVIGVFVALPVFGLMMMPPMALGAVARALGRAGEGTVADARAWFRSARCAGEEGPVRAS